MTELQKAILALLTECVEKQDCDVDVLGHIERLKKIAYPCEQDPRAGLKAQYALDVETCKDIDGLEAWQLWQVQLNKYGDWLDAGSNMFCEGDNYRLHPHADSIIEYHKCSERDKKRWQRRNYGGLWHDCDTAPDWTDDEYRLKPKTITIDGKEYAAPLRVAPEIGTKYWVCNFNFTTGFESWSVSWEGDSDDNCLLEKRHVFATKEDCKVVADAFNAILRGDSDA